MITVYGYTKCSTVKKTLNFIGDNAQYTHIDNVVTPLNVSQLHDLYTLSKVDDIKKLFNTSGIKYRELQLKDKIPTMSLDQALELLSSDGMLVKRPIITNGKVAVIGYKEDEILKLF